MRYDPLDPASRSSIARRYALDEPVAPGDWDDMPHATAAAPSRRATILRWTLRGLAAGIVLLVIAIAFGTINIVGGFMVTDRMLGMFVRKPKPSPDTSSASRPGASGSHEGRAT